MQLFNTTSLLTRSVNQLNRLEEAMSQRSNMLIFLMVRFVLMSGLVVGFSWWSLQLSP